MLIIELRLGGGAHAGVEHELVELMAFPRFKRGFIIRNAKTCKTTRGRIEDSCCVSVGTREASFLGKNDA